MANIDLVKYTVFKLAILAFLVLSTSHSQAAEGGDPLNLSIQENRISFQTEALQFHSGPPAVEVMVGKQLVKLTPAEQSKSSVENSQNPLGSAQAETWNWQDPRGFAFSRTVTRLTGRPGFTIKMTFTNQTKEPVNLRRFVLCEKTPDALTVAGTPADWLLSTPSSHSDDGWHRSLDLSKDGHLKFLDILTLFSERGAKGLVMGAAGPAESDIRYLCDIKNGRVTLQINSDMDDVVVDPGETRRSEELLVLVEPCDPALTQLFKWMAVTHGARTSKGSVYGWCSWYTKMTNIDQKSMEEVLNSLVENRERLPMQVFQIDDGWQKAYGDWTASPKKFPNGMKPIADKITAAGMTPGIWMTLVTSSTNGIHPDGNMANNLDPTFPATRDFIKNTLHERYAEGFRYFKLDFNHPRWKDRYNQKLTRLQVFRDMFKLYRESIGEDAYLCACVGGLDRGAIGYADSFRIGTDSGPRWLPMYTGCCMADLFNATGSMALTNGILFAADPDVAYTVPERYNKAVPLPNSVLAWHGYVGLLGGVVMTSDYFQVPPWNNSAAIRMMEILNPPAPEKGRAFDGQTDLWHRQFGFVANRPWGNFISVQLLNPSEEAASVPLKGIPVATIGSKFHVWSFWDRKYLGTADETLVLKNVPPGGGPLLRLTEIKGDPSLPVLVGSDLHIGMGAAEIQEIKTQPGQLHVGLTDAGARSGAIFFHSLKPLSAGETRGLVLKSVDLVEPGIWKVSIENRQHGKPQMVELKVAQ